MIAAHAGTKSTVMQYQSVIVGPIASAGTRRKAAATIARRQAAGVENRAQGARGPVIKLEQRPELFGHLGYDSTGRSYRV